MKNRFFTLMKNDLKILLRERALMGLFVIPFLLLLGAYFLVDFMQGKLNLVLYVPIVLTFLIIESPMLFGFINGFMLLEEKDENILSALQVLPMKKWIFIAYRQLFGTVFTFLVILLYYFVFPVIPLTFVEFFFLDLIISLEAPLLTLGVALIASNKVEGLAFFKFFNFIILLPFLQLFIHSNWHVLLGISYSYWPIRILFDGFLITNIPLYVWISGFCYHIALLVGVSVLFSKYPTISN